MRKAFVLLCALSVVSAASPQAPINFDPQEDLQNLGPREKFKFWTLRQKVASYRNMDNVFPTRRIPAGGKPLPLPEARVDLMQLQIPFGEGAISLQEFISEQRVAGLLVLKDGAIAYEQYAFENSRDSIWVSFSISKSVVSLLVGAAIQDGYIHSVDEKITDYVPRLKGSPYEQNSIQDLLQMASGVPWDETHGDPNSEVNVTPRETLMLFAHMRDKDRVAEPGTLFNYNSAEADILASVVRAAIGNNLSTYLSEKIWRPFGMEADANWYLNEPGGGERGACCISATLRDYGRIGQFALNKGQLADGTRVLPEDWIKDATSPSSSNPRYGYMWFPFENGAFAAFGLFGQVIYVDPAERVVIAMHSARGRDPENPNRNREQWRLDASMYSAVVAAVSE